MKPRPQKQNNIKIMNRIQRQPPPPNHSALTPAPSAVPTMHTPPQNEFITMYVGFLIVALRIKYFIMGTKH